MPTIRTHSRRGGSRSRSRQRRSKPPVERTAARNHFVAAAGEFLGTFMFLYLAFLGHSMAATTEPNFSGLAGPSNQQVIYISLAYGFSLLVTAWTLYRVSGGLFNPAVTLGLVVAGALPPMRGLVLFPVQVIAAMCAAALVSAMIPGPISIVETTLAPGVSVAQGVFLEMFLTAQLVLTILVLAVEKSKDTFIAPIGIGLALFICEIAGVYYTGASLNPARSFGPCVAAAHFQHYHWIYWIGPFMGALIAAGFYRFLLWINDGNLEAANPGQDSAGGAFVVESKEPEDGQDQGNQYQESQYQGNQYQGTQYKGNQYQSAGGYPTQSPQAYNQRPSSNTDRRSGEANYPAQNSRGYGQRPTSNVDRRSGDANRQYV